MIYLREMTTAMIPLLTPDERVILYVRPEFPVRAEWDDSPVEVETIRVRSLVGRIFAEQVTVQRSLAARGAALSFYPAELGPVFSSRPFVLANRNPNIFTPDSARLELPPLFQRVRHRFLGAGLRYSARRAAAVICLSDYARRGVISYTGVAPERVVLIPHGVTLRGIEAVPRERSGYILMVSNIQPHKSLDVLLRAYALLPSELRSRYRLRVVGDGMDSDYGRDCVRIAAEAGIRDRVDFVGPVAHDALATEYRRADIHVLPAELETFGMTVPEAMLAGVPCIGANAASVPEIMGDAGLLFEPGDAAGLAAAMTRLLSDSALYDDLAGRGRGRALEFTWERTARSTLELFRRVAGQGCRPQNI